MAFPPGFLDEIRARVSISDVVGRTVKLVKKGREYSGLCPFHNEKTPSFTVNNDKQFYHCFGCGAHGDAFKFVMEKQGLGFMEAVERLAGEAGLEMPQQTPQEVERAKRATSLYDLMETAATWFASMLQDTSAAHAANYLSGRGLTARTIARHQLGFAPNARQRLRQMLSAKGFSDSDAIEAGLYILPEDGGDPFDRFRDRIMFPIRDGQGRCIAFGGRAMSKEAKAKYLNSPETPLFQKGQTLYNMHLARKAAQQTGEITVAEGYMDVIALDQAGFGNAVAPLGTALTEQQLALLWRMADEPVLCFDGDTAGQRAAARAMERAMPLLAAGKSLRFAMLPTGKDPDDLIRAEGPEAMRAVLRQASTLIDKVWKSQSSSADLTTPERRAAFQRDALSAAREIADPTVKSMYESELRSRVRAHLRSFYAQRDGGQSYSRAGSGAAGGSKRFSGSSPFGMPRPGSSLKSSAIARAAIENQQPTHADSDTGDSGLAVTAERIILRTLAHHPSLLETHFEALASAQMATNQGKALLEAMLERVAVEETLDSRQFRDTLRFATSAVVLEAIEKDSFVRTLAFTGQQAQQWQAERGLLHTMSLLSRERQLSLELRTVDQKLTETLNAGDERAHAAALLHLKALKAELDQQHSSLGAFEDEGSELG